MLRTDSKPLRILLTEGASTSAREAVTALGLAGHRIEILDPDAHCICRFSRFVTKVHRCPPISTDPKAYLAFALKTLSLGKFDVLLPIHEQGLIFSKVPHLIPKGVGLALPTFEAYGTALDKARFSALMTELDIPQPRTRIVKSAGEIPGSGFPFVVKRPMSTASRGVHMVRSAQDLAAVRATETAPGDLLVQDLVDAPLEHAQLVFDHGRFVAMNGYRQIIRGAGGGEALKESVYRPRVRTEMEKFARALNWHGAFSLDYLYKDDVPYFVDCNPRLVEPMSAHFAGLDIAGLLVKVSRGETPPEANPPRTGVRTRLSLQALLGKALRTGSRRQIISEIWQFMAGTGPYAGSKEELTPVALDWMAIVPVAVTAFAVLGHPTAARILPNLGMVSGLLTPEAIRIITEEIN